ncbi:MAG: polymer-forming cytoskeletal protein [Methanoregulaceae archaeon]|nr:polymer-forming cytoskeletal protein [Methanoregulaceae archaeon]
MTQRPHNRRLRAGSALVFTSMLMVAIATVVVSTSQLNAAASSKAERRIEAVKAEESESGVLAAVQAKCNVNSIALPQIWNFSLNGQTQSVEIVDNNASQSRTYAVTTTVNGKETRVFKRIIGGRQTSNPLYFAVWLNGSTDLSSNCLTTTNGGHVYCRGNLTLGPTSSIDGEVYAVGSLTDNGATVTKNVLQSVRNRVAPTMTRADYETAASGLINLVSSITNIVFAPVSVGLPYSLRYYRDPEVRIQGTVSGKGTVYIEGSARVEADISYTTAAARAIFIVEGDLRVNNNVNRLDGTWFVKGTLRIDNAGTALAMTRGALIALGPVEINRDVTINADNTFWTSRNEGTKHRAPGFWPVAVDGLLR